jgi:cellulose synthase/poly-beta-1,6-N-acetylglucosamine synthase-like glycosyltransferase
MLSVIIAARNEEEAIEQTVRSLLNQSYPALEIIAVNDRSTDQTGPILDQLLLEHQSASSDISLSVIHVSDLPDGWLGKNHALYTGYQQATGELLLFTDADVLYEPKTIAHTVRFMQQGEVDHLTLNPRFISDKLELKAFVHYFFFTFWLFTEPWQGNLPEKKDKGIGIGAFNCMRRRAYENIGSHQAIARRPDDDLMLGKLVKQNGLKQRVLNGRRLIAVPWYPNLFAAIRGFEKNMFAGLGYKLSHVCLAVVGQLLVYFLPFVAVWVTSGWSQLAYALSVAIMISLYLLHTRILTGYKGFEVVLLPFSVLLFVYVIIRSTVITLKQGGIYWRGTFYSLKELKKH